MVISILGKKILVYAGMCDYPLEEGITSSVEVIGFTNPALEGTSIMLHCPARLTLIGPESSTCMGNGKWEPDPGEVECIGIGIISFLIAIIVCITLI